MHYSCEVWNSGSEYNIIPISTSTNFSKKKYALYCVLCLAASGTTSAPCIVFRQINGRCIPKLRLKKQGQVYPEPDCIQARLPYEVVFLSRTSNKQHFATIIGLKHVNFSFSIWYKRFSVWSDWQESSSPQDHSIEVSCLNCSLVSRLKVERFRQFDILTQ